MKSVLTFAAVLVSVVTSAPTFASMSCKDQVYMELEQIHNSSYWQARKKELVELLSGYQPRGCQTGGNPTRPTAKTEIFADDVQQFTTAKFKGELLDGLVLRPGSEESVRTSFSGFGADMVASLRIETKEAVITGIDAERGTNAQCSPKVLLANVIAQVKDVLQAQCGENHKVHSPSAVKAREDFEALILAAE